MPPRPRCTAARKGATPPSRTSSADWAASPPRTDKVNCSWWMAAATPELVHEPNVRDALRPERARVVADVVRHSHTPLRVQDLAVIRSHTASRCAGLPRRAARCVSGSAAPCSACCLRCAGPAAGCRRTPRPSLTQSRGCAPSAWTAAARSLSARATTGSAARSALRRWRSARCVPQASRGALLCPCSAARTTARRMAAP